MEFKNPELQEKVAKALDEIRPYLQKDGGNISLLEVDDTNNVVQVRLEGNCANCSINQMTLKAGVEYTIKQHAPQIEKVINIEA